MQALRICSEWSVTGAATFTGAGLAGAFGEAVPELAAVLGFVWTQPTTMMTASSARPAATRFVYATLPVA